LARAEFPSKGDSSFAENYRKVALASYAQSKTGNPHTMLSGPKFVQGERDNKVAQHKAQQVEKGELDMDAPGCGACGGSSLVPMGSLGARAYHKCMSCGMIGSTTPREENTAAKEVVEPTVAKNMAKLPDGSGCATGVVKSEPLATVRTTKMKGISSLPAPKSKMVVKAETNPNTKQADTTGTVEAKNVKGAKDGSESVPEAKKTDGSGDVSKGKIEKGAMIDTIKQQSAKAGVPVKSVLGYQPPKTLAAVKPAPTPNFNKSNIPMTGVASEMAIKTGKPVIPGRPLVPKLTGGVQTQIAAQKKPMIPMVNTGVVAKGKYRPLEPYEMPGEKDKLKAIQKKKITKAEPTMAKPVTKSPSSAPAGKTTAPKASTVAPKAASKL
jgi:hypothetical protein